MPALKACFEENGFDDVVTYIQSGNVLFTAPTTQAAELTLRIEAMLAQAFDYVPTVVVRTRRQMRAIVDRAPRGFGREPAKYRYDVIFLREPLAAKVALQSVPTKPGVDAAHPGTGVLYFSRLSAKASQSRLSRIASSPIYASVTGLGHLCRPRLAVASARRVRTTFFTSAVGSGRPYSKRIVPFPVTRDPSSSRCASIAFELIGKKL
jgi:uncharacterized protein (DUF1697 family)